MGGFFKYLSDQVRLKQVRKARKRQVTGMITGILFVMVLVLNFIYLKHESWLSKGRLTPGHEALDCGSCHHPAEGTWRQQLQAKAKFVLGFRHSDADFGLMKVDNAKCLNCHDRPGDHHPVFRFNEPRFAEVRQELDATQCGSCHTEHTGTLANIPVKSICLNCHQDLKIKDDPLEVSHEQIIAEPIMVNCMQCHDFHGNHIMELPITLEDTISMQAIKEYLNKGTDPYSNDKFSKAITHE